MTKKALSQRISLLVVFCLFITACADFFKSDKSAAPSPDNNPTSTPQKPSGTLPPEFADPNAGAFTEKKMLINIGTQVLAKATESLTQQVPALKNSLDRYCTALQNGGNADREASLAKADWERVMLAYHEIEAAPFGPLLEQNRFLIDNLYSWPYLNTCAIDKKVVENLQTPVNVSSLIFNMRGLGAVEYLLFEGSLKSSCNPRANPEMAQWNNRESALKKTDRCLFARALAQDIEDKARLLHSRWAVEQGNFTLSLVNGSLYSDEKKALNALTDALAHIEVLKDAKLGRPLGRHKDCTEDKCPRDVEHIYSGLSLASAEAQLKGFKAIFTGSYQSHSTAFGIDDLLIKAGREDVANNVVAALNKALASLQTAQVQGSLQEQADLMDSSLCKSTSMTDRKEEICAVHADVREVAFLLKTQVLAALALRAPPTHQGDND
ncbi:MAG: imelysin family protein [Bdellovibrio sp.]